MNKPEKTPKLLFDLIYDSINTAPKALARIALYVAQEPEGILTLSVAELARHTESGQASVVRYCRMLGFSGFREFKIALSGEIERDKARRYIHNPVAGEAQIAPEIAGLSAALQRSLVDSARILNGEQIERLAQRIRGARRVEIFGMGVSNICADLLAMRLIWLGIPVHSLSSPTVSCGLARTLDASSLAIGISYGGLTEETKVFLEAARGAGAHTLAITTRADCPVAFAAKEVLLLSSAGPWPEAGSARLMPSMTLLVESIALYMK